MKEIFYNLVTENYHVDKSMDKQIIQVLYVATVIHLVHTNSKKS